MGRITTATVLLFLFCQASPGQTSRVMYFMDLPQARFHNPAFSPTDSLYIGIPVITGVGFSINNNFVGFSDVIMRGRSDSLITFLHPDYDKEKFLSKLRKHNSIDADMIVQLLGFGITLGRGYLFIDINERLGMTSSLPRDLLLIAIRGNEGFAGKYTDLSSLAGGFNYYHEAGIGYSREILPGIRGGFRAKFLFGVAASTLVNRNLGVTIFPDFSHEIVTDIALNSHGPLAVLRDGGDIDNFEFSRDELVQSIMMKNINPGAGLDLGLTYDISKEIQVSAAVTDIGFIRWRKQVTNVGIAQSFQITGVNVSDVLRGEQSFSDALGQVLDTLQNSVSFTSNTDPFSTFLPMRLNLGGSYRIRPDLSVGLLSHSRFTGGRIRQSVTLSANYYIQDKLSASLAYTIANNRFDNIGAGIAYRAGVFQFYAASDRIPVVWNRITANDGDTSFLIPNNWNTIDVRIGMNLVFGKARYSKTGECDFWYR
jgi:hypothetical protein